MQHTLPPGALTLPVQHDGATVDEPEIASTQSVCPGSMHPHWAVVKVLACVQAAVQAPAPAQTPHSSFKTGGVVPETGAQLAHSPVEVAAPPHTPQRSVLFVPLATPAQSSHALLSPSHVPHASTDAGSPLSLVQVVAVAALKNEHCPGTPAPTTAPKLPGLTPGVPPTPVGGPEPFAQQFIPYGSPAATQSSDKLQGVPVAPDAPVLPVAPEEPVGPVAPVVAL
jgi:hypothetical protein